MSTIKKKDKSCFKSNTEKYIKTSKIIMSCKNLQQLESARKYSSLFSSMIYHCPPEFIEQYEHFIWNINRLIKAKESLLK